MTKRFLSLIFAAPLVIAAAPYTDQQLAAGFAQVVSNGRDYSPLLSTPVSEATAENLQLLTGCKIELVESLAMKGVAYVIEWKCKRLPKGTKFAAIVKIADGKIYNVEMTEQL